MTDYGARHELGTLTYQAKTGKAVTQKDYGRWLASNLVEAKIRRASRAGKSSLSRSPEAGQVASAPTAPDRHARVSPNVIPSGALGGSSHRALPAEASHSSSSSAPPPAPAAEARQRQPSRTSLLDKEDRLFGHQYFFQITPP